MTVTFTLNSDDLRAFQDWARRNLPSSRRTNYMVLGMMVVFGLLMTLSTEDRDPVYRIIYFCLFMGIYWLFVKMLSFVLIRVASWRSYTPDKHQSILCEHTITLEQDVLIESTIHNETKQRWGGMYRVLDTPDYIYLFVTIHSAHVIPKRAFADAEEARRFHDEALRLFEAARSAGAKRCVYVMEPFISSELNHPPRKPRHRRHERCVPPAVRMNTCMISETFDQACAIFTDHLKKHGMGHRLVWVCREDVLFYGGKIFVHPHPPATNQELYRHHYEFGARGEMGMRLEASCFAGDEAFCHVWVPRDEMDASYAMMTGSLRLTFALDNVDNRRGRTATLCRSRLTFRCRRWWSKTYPKTGYFDDVPSRKELATRNGATY